MFSEADVLAEATEEDVLAELIPPDTPSFYWCFN